MNYPTSPHRMISEAELREMETRIADLKEELRHTREALGQCAGWKAWVVEQIDSLDPDADTESLLNAAYDLWYEVVEKHRKKAERPFEELVNALAPYYRND